MGEREYIIKGLRNFLENLSKDLKIDKIIFFGSRANGTATTESDIDLIIVSKDFGKLNFIERTAKMYDYWQLDMPVDFLCFTPIEFEKLRKRVSIVSEALKEGIVI